MMPLQKGLFCEKIEWQSSPKWCKGGGSSVTKACCHQEGPLF